MTKLENRLYEKAEKTETMSIELQETLHEIFYDPEGATNEDLAEIYEIHGLLKQAIKLADRIERRLHA